MILAVSDNDQIIVERQYRRGVDDFVYEIPAGWIEDGETPLQAGIRELKEETGFTGTGEKWYEIYPEPAFMSMKAYVVPLRFSSENEGKAQLGMDEHLKYELMDIDKVKEMIKNGEIKDMGFLSAMTFLNQSI